MLPTRLAPDEDYATVDDILTCDDLQQATIRVPNWRKNGKPMAIRVRALSLMQRELVSRESVRADGTVDVVAQLEATLREGVLLPKFDINTASKLRHKNGAVLEQIAAFIWTMSKLDQEFIDATVQRLSGAKPAEPAA